MKEEDKNITDKLLIKEYLLTNYCSYEDEQEILNDHLANAPNLLYTKKLAYKCFILNEN